MHPSRIISFISLSIIFLPSSGWTRVFTLKEAISGALDRSPQVSAAHFQRESARESRESLTGSRLPQVRFTSQYTRGDNPVYVFGSLLNQNRFKAEHFSLSYLNQPPDLTNFQNKVEASVPLFTGFELSDRKKMASLGVKQAEAGVAGARIDSTARLIASYLGLLKSREITAMLDARIQSAEKELLNAEKLMRKGLVLGSDYYAAKGVLFGLKARRTKSLYDENDFESRLKIQLGLASGETAEPAGRLSRTDYTVPSEQELAAWAESRPDIQAAATAVDMADRAKKLENRSVLPRAVAFASAETNTPDFEKNPSHQMGGVRVEALFGDFSYRSRGQKAEADKKSAQASLDFSREQAKTTLISLRQSFLGGRSALEELLKAREEAERSLELFKPLYREGRQSVLEVIRAEDALAQIDEQIISVKHGLHSLYTGLLAAGGRLTEETAGVIQDKLAAGGDNGR